MINAIPLLRFPAQFEVLGKGFLIIAGSFLRIIRVHPRKTNVRRVPRSISRPKRKTKLKVHIVFLLTDSPSPNYEQYVRDEDSPRTRSPERKYGVVDKNNSRPARKRASEEEVNKLGTIAHHPTFLWPSRDWHGSFRQLKRRNERECDARIVAVSRGIDCCPPRRDPLEETIWKLTKPRSIFLVLS